MVIRKTSETKLGYTYNTAVADEHTKTPLSRNDKHTHTHRRFRIGFPHFLVIRRLFNVVTR